MGVRTIDIGLRFRLLEEIVKHPRGITAEALAKVKGLDPFYVQVWCRSAYASELLELGENQTYRLAPYIDKLLLEEDFPGYIGAMSRLMVHPEIFDEFVEKLPSGQQTWWDQHSPAFIQLVSGAGRPLLYPSHPRGPISGSGSVGPVSPEGSGAGTGVWRGGWIDAHGTDLSPIYPCGRGWRCLFLGTNG